MKKVYTIIIALALCFAFTGCNDITVETVETMDAVETVDPVESVDVAETVDAAKSDAVETVDATESLDSAESDNSEEVALGYADPIIDMFIVIDGPGWAYIKSKDGSQVYFFLKEDETGINMISISSQDFEGKAEDRISEIWDMVKGDLNAEQSKPADIKVGQYKGVYYQYSLDINGETLECKYMFWATDERLYICTVSADSNHTETVDSAVNSILETFETINDKES